MCHLVYLLVSMVTSCLASDFMLLPFKPPFLCRKVLSTEPNAVSLCVWWNILPTECSLPPNALEGLIASLVRTSAAACEA